MLALYRCGRQAEALEAYRHARDDAGRGDRRRAGPELRRLHDAILRQDPSLDVEPRRAELPRELDAAASPPLIGRDDELRGCGRAGSGGAGAARSSTLVGAYGMGKTRLAAELAGDAHREGARGALRGRHRAARGRARGDRARARRAAARRCSCSTTPTARRPRCAPRCASSAARRAPALVLATGQQAAALARLEPRESLALEPLDADGVRAIAGFYAPAGGDDPGRRRCSPRAAASPRRVHEAASEWARREATRRVDAARRPRGGRPQRGARARGRAGRAASSSCSRRASALARLGADDGRRAGGLPVQGPRDVRAPTTPSTSSGASGSSPSWSRGSSARRCSPSSARRAAASRRSSGPGCCPRSRAACCPAATTGRRRVIRPGEHPLRELRRATRRLAPRAARRARRRPVRGAVHRLPRTRRERAEFVAALVRALATRRRRRARRARRLLRPLRRLPRAVARCSAPTTCSSAPMSRDELRRAIERPAQRVGLSVEPELVDALLADVEGQPGALPLLSTALLELWRAARRAPPAARRLRAHAAACRAPSRGWPRTPSSRSTRRSRPRRARCCCGSRDEDEGGAIVRRRVALDELDATTPRSSRRLADRRLLTVSDGAVEVAHEALLREWPRLRGWLDEDARGPARCTAGSATPRARGTRDARDPGGLYRGARLAAALDWAAGHDAELERDRARVPRRQPAARAGAPSAGCGWCSPASPRCSCVAVIAGVVALDQRGQRARRGHGGRGAAPRRAGARRRTTSTARCCSRARAWRWTTRLQTRGNLLAALLKSPAAIGVLRGDGGRLVGARPQPRRPHAARARRRRHAAPRRPRAPRRQSRRRGRCRASRRDRSRRRRVRFSADGSRLAVGGVAAGRPRRRARGRVSPRLRGRRSRGSSCSAALLAGRAHAVRGDR